MATIQDLIDHYPEIIQAITAAEFSSPVLFKGFCKAEEHRFFLLVQDNSSAPFLKRRATLDSALERIMGNCNIRIDLPEDFEPDGFLSDINDTNSVALTSTPPIEALERVYGRDWEFTPLHTAQKLTAQTQMWQPVAVHDEHANHARVSPTPTPIAGHS